MSRLLLIVVVLCFGCMPPPANKPAVTIPVTVYVKPEPAPPPTKPTAYSRKDIRAAVLGLTTREVKELLGAPTRIDTSGGGSSPIWAYENIVINEDTGKPEHRAILLFTFNVCEKVAFYPRRHDDPR